MMDWIISLLASIAVVALTVWAAYAALPLLRWAYAG
jgi:hypothetical protein